jgi:hypothetical protein
MEDFTTFNPPPSSFLLYSLLYRLTHELRILVPPKRRRRITKKKKKKKDVPPIIIIAVLLPSPLANRFLYSSPG